MPRTKRRTDALRERGLEAALGLLTEAGVAGLTAREVARRAGASVPAVYEVFGDKVGLIREIFFEGFRMLGAALSATPVSGEPLTDLRRLAEAHRRFVVAHPVLAQVMFSQPFAAFDPTTAEVEAGAEIRHLVMARVRDAVDAGHLVGDPTDIAHVFVSLIQGLAAAEASQRLGRSRPSVQRRWNLALDAFFRGLGPPAAPHQPPSTRPPSTSRRPART